MRVPAAFWQFIFKYKALLTEGVAKMLLPGANETTHRQHTNSPSRKISIFIWSHVSSRPNDQSLRNILVTTHGCGGMAADGLLCWIKALGFQNDVRMAVSNTWGTLTRRANLLTSVFQMNWTSSIDPFFHDLDLAKVRSLVFQMSLVSLVLVQPKFVEFKLSRTLCNHGRVAMLFPRHFCVRHTTALVAAFKQKMVRMQVSKA